MNNLSKSTARNHPLIRNLIRLLEIILIIAMAVLVLDVLWGVISRILSKAGLFENPASWTEELARYLLIWVGLLGACLAFEKRAHLGVDFFVGKFDPTARRILALTALGLVLVFAIAALVIGGTQMVTRTLALGQTTPTLGIAKGWVYLVVPISGVFTAIFAIAQMVDVLKRPTTANEAAGEGGLVE